MSESKSDLDEALGLIEIKSALQWRQVSQRVNWSDSSIPNSDTNDQINEPNKSMSNFKPTLINELRLVCWRIKPWNEPKRGADLRLFSTEFAVKWGVDCDEVVQNLFVADKKAAGHIRFLQKLGITHVLNTAEGKEDGLVDLNSAHYIGSNITYLGLPLWDTTACNIRAYLGCAAEYIGKALGNGGKCLVNCQMGVSRSSSCAIAHLMINEKWTAKEALTRLRKRRDVRPNDGFLAQIAELDNELRLFRDHGGAKPTLSSLQDLEQGLLPMPWNQEFWTETVTEEEIGYPIVPLGQTPFGASPINLSPLSSALSSRRVSLRRSKERSNSASVRNSTSLSRNASLKKKFDEDKENKETSCHYSGQNTPSKLRKIDNSDNSNNNINNNKNTTVLTSDEEDWGDDWEWEEEEEEQCSEPLTTTKKLELVCDIVARPEEGWRYAWRRSSAERSIASSNLSRRSSTRRSANSLKEIQPGLENNDPLSIVKNCTAKQWRALTNLLDFKLDDVESNNSASKNIENTSKMTLTNFDENYKADASFVPTTVRQLRLLFWKIKPWDQPQGSRRSGLFSSIMGERWGVDCDELAPNLFVGDEESARNIAFLRHVGIKHVLNSSEGKESGCVDLNKDYFRGENIEYLGLPLWDHECANMLNFVGCANEFVEKARKRGEKCLVFCELGVSCSGAFAIAHMMLSEKWSAVEAVREFRRFRDIRPNDHFLEQIVQLDNELRYSRQTGNPGALHMKRLDEIENLPQPWHFEYWSSPPQELPFKLTYHHKSHTNEHEPKNEEDVKTKLALPEINKPSEILNLDKSSMEHVRNPSFCSVGTNTSPQRSWSPSICGSSREPTPQESEDVKETSATHKRSSKPLIGFRSRSLLSVHETSTPLSTSAPSKLYLN